MMSQTAQISPQAERLLEAGLKLFHERGFGAVGVREIADAAGAPQGSFTNHFRSKEAFGRLVLDRYFAKLEALMAATLARRDISPRERIVAYLDRIETELARRGWRTGCLVADLSGEIPIHSETIRLRLAEILDAQTRLFGEAISDTGAPATPEGISAEDRAGALLAAWHGTLMRMKVEQDAGPIWRFRRTLPLFLPAD